MRISDWSSDVCSSDLSAPAAPPPRAAIPHRTLGPLPDPQDGVEDRRRVGGGDDIVRHDAEGALEMGVGPADRKSGVSGKSVPRRVYLGGSGVSKKRT